MSLAIARCGFRCPALLLKGVERAIRDGLSTRTMECAAKGRRGGDQPAADRSSRL